MTEKARAKRYAMYLRRSSDDTTKQVRSIKDQKDACLRLLKEHGIIVKSEDIIEEERSARKSGNRPKFTKLIADIRRGKIDGIVAWAPDRLARNMKEAGEIIDLLDERYLVDLKFAAHSFTNDYNGVMMLGLAFVLAKQYTDKLSDDVRRGVVKAFREGKSSGQHKPGYIRDDKTGYYEPDETECVGGVAMFRLVQSAWEKRVRGETLDTITKYLNANGYFRQIKRTGEKQKMTREKLRNIFSDSFYYGILMQAGEKVDLNEVVGSYQPMIDQADFMRVQRFTRPELSVPKKHRFPFKEVLHCGDCGKQLTAGAPKGRAGDRYLRYWCGQKGCPNASIRAKDVMAAMSSSLEGLRGDSKTFASYRRKALQALDGARRRLISEQANRAKQKKRDESLLEQLLLQRCSDHMEEKIIARKKERVKASLAKTERRMFEIDNELANLEPLDVETFLNTVKTVAERLKFGSPGEKDRIAQSVFLNIIVKSGKVAAVSLREPFASMLDAPQKDAGAAPTSHFEHFPEQVMGLRSQGLLELLAVDGKRSSRSERNATHYDEYRVY